jgi:hypothetical protein
MLHPTDGEAMSESTTHSYYDWQVSTLMLAMDVVHPLRRDDLKSLEEREKRVQVELRDMVHRTLPKSYLDNPEEEFPPAIVAMLTRATLKMASEIVDGKIK